MEETSTSEEVRIVQDHTDEDEEACTQRGDEELLAGADAAEEATTETADEHQTPVDGSQKSCIRRLEVEALTIEVDIVPYADFDTDIHEDSDDTESEVREAPYALFEDFAFLLLRACDRGEVELRERCDKTTDEDDEYEEGDVERAQSDVQTALTCEDDRSHEDRSDGSHRRVGRTSDRLTRDTRSTLHVTSDDVGVQHCLQEGHSRACYEASQKEDVVGHGDDDDVRIGSSLELYEVY